MPDPIESRPTPWNTVILVCGKCSRKLDGGYGPKGKATLRSALRDVLRERGERRRVRVAETNCFGVCPKKAVVTLNATAPARLLTIPRGTGADAALQEILSADGSTLAR